MDDRSQKNGLPYYKAYPRDFFEGTLGMSFEVKGAYRLLLDLIYMQGGHLNDDARYIAGLLGCSVRAWNRYRSELLEKGKIYSELGIISNFRADNELNVLRSFQDKQRENGSRPKKNNSLPKPALEPTPKPNENHTESESDKKESPLPPKGGETDLFLKIWEAFPRNPMSAEGPAEREWLKLSPADQAKLLNAVDRFRQWFEADARRRGETFASRLSFAPHLAKWISTGSWRNAEQLPDVNAPAVPMVRISRSADPGLWAEIELLRKKPIPTSDDAWSVPQSQYDQAVNNLRVKADG